MALSDDDVREILRIIDESKLDELRLETPAFSLHVSKSANANRADLMPHSAHPDAIGAAPTGPLPDAEISPAALSASANASLREIDAPMLGTFYRAESPSDPPFVDIGTQVDEDTVVGLIEVMKLMNYIQADTSGVIAEVLVENATLVEFGETLFRVTPHP